MQVRQAGQPINDDVDEIVEDLLLMIRLTMPNPQLMRLIPQLSWLEAKDCVDLDQDLDGEYTIAIMHSYRI